MWNRLSSLGRKQKNTLLQNVISDIIDHHLKLIKCELTCTITGFQNKIWTDWPLRHKLLWHNYIKMYNLNSISNHSIYDDFLFCTYALQVSLYFSTSYELLYITDYLTDIRISDSGLQCWNGNLRLIYGFDQYAAAKGL